MMEIDGKAATSDDMAALALYNYGHFTSMTVEDGAVRGLRLHLDRLVDDCRTLFAADLDRDWVRQLLRRAVADLPSPSVARVTVFAPNLELGHPGATLTPHVLITARPASSGRLPALRLTSHRYERDLPETKHVGLFATVLHRRAAQLTGADDVLFVDSSGRASEGATWNIGFFDGHQVAWPQAPCLPGVTMRLLKQALTDAGINSVDAVVDASFQDQVSAAFVTNAAVGVRPVASIDDKVYAEDAPILERLRELYLSIPSETI